MARRILILALAIASLGIGFTGGYLIRGPKNPVARGSVMPSPGRVTTVPDIVGLNLAAALQNLQAAGLAADITAYRQRDKARGLVISQSPQNPMRVAEGTAVVVGVSAGYSLKPLGVAMCMVRSPEPPGSPPCFGGFGRIPVTVLPGE
jgi:PASTA domain